MSPITKTRVWFVLYVNVFVCIPFTGTSSFAFVEFYEAKDAARWMEKVLVCTHMYTSVYTVYCMCMYMYMEMHVFSTLAYENKKDNPPNHYLDKQTYIARDTWMPSLENWGGGLKIFCG